MSPSLKPEQWQSIQHLFEGQRLRRGWTREELARKAGLSRTTLFYFFERSGTQQPRLTTIKRLAETFELDFQQIIDQSFAPSNSTSESSNRLGFQVPSSFPLSTPFSPGFDRQTNPVVQEVLDESPVLFQEFTSTDWDELYSCMGMGGALTHEGVRDQASRISRKKQLVRKLEVLLETHFSEVTAALLETLFRQIQVSSPTCDLHAGWQAPSREPPPGSR